MKTQDKALSEIKCLANRLALSFDGNVLVLDESLTIATISEIELLKENCKLLGEVQKKELLNFFENKACQ